MSGSAHATHRSGAACRLSVDTTTVTGDGAALAVLFAAPLPAWSGALARAASPVIRSLPLTSLKRGRTVSLSMAMSPGHWVLGAALLQAPAHAGALFDEVLDRLKLMLDGGLPSTDDDGWSGPSPGAVIVPANDHPLGRLNRGPAHLVLRDLVSERQISRHAAFERVADFRPALDVVTRLRRVRPPRGTQRDTPTGAPIESTVRSACFSRIIVAGPRDVERPFDIPIQGSAPDDRKASVGSRFVGSVHATTSMSAEPTTAGGRRAGR